jgi:hypothetical protein
LTTQQAPEELTWKRQPMGEYVARHGFWVYTVFRDAAERRGDRQWTLEAYPEGNMDDSQARTGFDTARTAKLAALSTRCALCNRHMPFGELEAYGDKPRALAKTWRCRDRGPCEAEQARQSAEARNFELEYRRTDHDEIYIREDEYGPQLVLRQGGQGTVVNVTEADLDTVARLVWERRAAEGLAGE